MTSMNRSGGATTRSRLTSVCCKGSAVNMLGAAGKKIKIIQSSRRTSAAPRPARVSSSCRISLLGSESVREERSHLCATLNPSWNCMCKQLMTIWGIASGSEEAGTYCHLQLDEWASCRENLQTVKADPNLEHVIYPSLRVVAYYG